MNEVPCVNRRRVIAALAALPGVVGAACAARGQTGSAPSPGALAPAAITFWPVARGPDADRVFGQQLVPAFRTRYPQVTVDVTPTPSIGEINPKVIAAAAAGTLPDIAAAGGGNVIGMAQLGIPTALDERVRQWGVRDDFYPSGLKLCTWKERLQGLPFRVATPAYYWRQDLLREAGVAQPPETWEACLDAARRLTKLEGDAVVRPGFAHAGAARLRFEFFQFMRSLDAPLVRAGRAVFNGAEGLAVGQFLTDRGAVVPPGTAVPTLAGNELGLAQVGGAYAEPATLRTVKAQTPDQYGQVVLGPPLVPGGQRYRAPDPRRVRPAVFGNPDWYFLTSASRHPDQAWEFLKHLLSPEPMVTYNEAELYLVTRKSAAQLGFMREEKVQALAEQFAKYGQTQYKLADASKMNPSIDAALAAIVQGTVAPKQALDTSAREWDQIMGAANFTGDSD